MSLANIKNLQREKGFTIVELLIVIVVIAILAAIVLVAYNGIQNSAKTTSGQSAASQVQKKVEAYNAATGSYPTATTNSTFQAALNGQEESTIGSITIGTPTSSNGESTVQIERCTTVGASGFRYGWFDFSAGAVVAEANRFVTPINGTCSAWSALTAS